MRARFNLKRAHGHFAVAVLLVALGACASGARTNEMVVRADASPRLDEPSPLHRSIALGRVDGGEETDPWWTSEVGTGEFREALRLSLEEHGYLAGDPAAAPYELSAVIVEVKQPGSSYTITVDSFVRYKLRQASGQTVIFDDVVRGSHTATVEDAFVGMERLQITNEGAMRDNIAALLARLERLRIGE